MKIFFLVHIVAGIILGIISLIFLPRWESLDQKLFQGFGLVLPWILAFVIVGFLLFYFDVSTLNQKLLKLGLMLLAEIVTLFIVIKSIRIGF